MATPRAQLVLNGAPSRYDRALRALGRDYARVDGRTFDELLDFAVRYAALVNFYDLRNEIDGDWVEFFLCDPTMVLATLAAFDAPAAEATFERSARRTREARGFERKFRGLRDTFETVLGLARLVNASLRALTITGRTNPLLRDEIEAAVAGELGTRLRELRAWDEGAASARALGRALGLDWSGFLPAWELDSVRPDASVFRGRTRARRIERALPRLRPIVAAFESALSSWSAFAHRHLPATLKQNDHKPQIALFMAFARLFRRAQRTLDTYARRYARFYERDVLRARRRGPLPDATWLTFTLAQEEGVTGTNVPRGTLFPAGQDAQGRALLYAADEPLRVSAATLAQVLMLRQQRGPLYDAAGTSAPARSDDGATPVVRRLLASTVALDDAAGEGATPAGWATFGLDAAGDDGPQSARPATLGFALASPYLYLTGGTRTVTLTLSFAPGEARDRLNARLDELAAVTGLTSDEVLRGVAGAAWRLRLSTVEGWFEVQSYECPPPGSDDVQVTQLLLRFTLTPGAPPVVPIDPETAGDDVGLDPAPGLPTLEAFLEQTSVPLAGPRAAVTVPPLALLGEIELATVAIAVDVAGLGELSLETTDGPVDTSAPFALFGGTPVVGAYMRVQHSELFVKTPASVTLQVKWFDLPSDATGFEGYYRDYVLGADGGPLVPPYDNAVFHGRLGVRAPGTWWIVAADVPSVEVSLFRTRSVAEPDVCDPAPPTANGELCPVSVFGPYTPAAHTAPQYYRPEDSALQLELRAPRNGFGDDLYSINVLNSIVKDLPEADPQKELRYPNAPWLPQAEQVSVDYSASCQLDTAPVGSEPGRFLHLTPFGGYERVPLSTQRPARLLPHEDADGRLLLGFTSLLPPQPLTLFFQLAATGDEPTPPELPAIAWEYLSADVWVPLAAAQVPRDTTLGLQNTGIVALALPSYAAARHTRLPADYAWLCARVDAAAGAFPRTLTLLPHATTASWVDDGSGGGEHLRQPLPAHTITGSVEDLPYVASIDQPVASVGGRPREDTRAFETRLGERLRHKERAALSWDYERLVFERFPAVWQVQALPAHDRKQGRVPGAVMVMVVAGADAAPGLDPTAPAAPAEMLARIRTYLEERTSPFVRLEVVNPVYVRIRVRADVELRAARVAGGGGLDRLEAELVRYLSPWFYDAERAAKGGQYASEDEISAFIQTRPYVAALNSIAFDYAPRPETLAGDWYFLTSAERHELREASAGPDCDGDARDAERQKSTHAGPGSSGGRSPSPDSGARIHFGRRA